MAPHDPTISRLTGGSMTSLALSAASQEEKISDRDARAYADSAVAFHGSGYDSSSDNFLRDRDSLGHRALTPSINSTRSSLSSVFPKVPHPRSLGLFSRSPSQTSMSSTQVGGGMQPPTDSVVRVADLTPLHLFQIDSFLHPPSIVVENKGRPSALLPQRRSAEAVPEKKIWEPVPESDDFVLIEYTKYGPVVITSWTKATDFDRRNFTCRKSGQKVLRRLGQAPSPVFYINGDELSDEGLPKTLREEYRRAEANIRKAVPWAESFGTTFFQEGKLVISCLSSDRFEKTRQDKIKNKIQEETLESLCIKYSGCLDFSAFDWSFDIFQQNERLPITVKSSDCVNHLGQYGATLVPSSESISPRPSTETYASRATGSGLQRAVTPAPGEGQWFSQNFEQRMSQIDLTLQQSPTAANFINDNSFLCPRPVPPFSETVSSSVGDLKKRKCTASILRIQAQQPDANNLSRGKEFIGKTARRIVSPKFRAFLRGAKQSAASSFARSEPTIYVPHAPTETSSGPSRPSDPSNSSNSTIHLPQDPMAASTVQSASSAYLAQHPTATTFYARPGPSDRLPQDFSEQEKKRPTPKKEPLSINVSHTSPAIKRGTSVQARAGRGPGASAPERFWLQHTRNKLSAIVELPPSRSGIEELPPSRAEPVNGLIPIWI